MTPWLIVMGHKQGWMDSIGAGNWSAIETILQANGADMYFTGHTHVSGSEGPGQGNDWSALVEGNGLTGGQLNGSCPCMS
jgi:hypothetical protein